MLLRGFDRDRPNAAARLYTSWCRVVCVSRTNIDLDDELVDRVMRLYRLDTKREAVQLALERLVDRPMTVEEMLAMEGAGWAGDLDELRGTDPADASA